jgi:hypothetical protein
MAEEIRHERDELLWRSRELEQRQAEGAARELTLRTEIATLRRDLHSQAQERDLAFQEAGCLRLESEQIRVHQAELERARTEAEQRHQEAIAHLHAELESRYREGLARERQGAERGWEALLAEVETLRESLEDRSSQADSSRRDIEHLAGREAELSRQIEFLSETLARQAREFEAERQALHLTIAGLQQILEETKIAEDEAALDWEGAPSGNGSDAHHPLLVPHVEHATPPPPHVIDQEPSDQSVAGGRSEPERSSKTDARPGESGAIPFVPARFGLDTDDSVEDPLRALRPAQP